MPFSIQWGIEKRIIHKRYYGDVTLEEFQQAIQETRDYALQGTPLIHTIDDMSAVTSFPIQLGTLIKTVGSVDNTIFGYTVIVGNDKLMNFLANIVTQKMQARYRPVSTYEEAQSFLMDVDASLESHTWISSDIPNMSS
jgi:hypothetical protein